MLKKVVPILLLFFYAQVAVSQSDDCELKLSGTVKSSDSSEPIPFATLQLIEQKQSVVADANGKFVFEHLCSGRFEVLIKFSGYKDYRTTFDLAQADLDVEIMLETNVVDLGGVTVEGRTCGPDRYTEHL